MYTIFKNPSSIFLTDDPKFAAGKNHLLWNDYGSFRECEAAFLPEENERVILGEDLPKLWKEFRMNFKVIEAAGGIVKNSTGEFLFIWRQEKWDLPKGKIEQGESREEAALREVKEECGFKSLELGPYLDTTYHIYTEKEVEVLKVSHWYEMFSDDVELTPQLEEGISKLTWVAQDHFDRVLDNTYPNIVLLLDRYKSAHQKTSRRGPLEKM